MRPSSSATSRVRAKASMSLPSSAASPGVTWPAETASRMALAAFTASPAGPELRKVEGDGAVPACRDDALQTEPHGRGVAGDRHLDSLPADGLGFPVKQRLDRQRRFVVSPSRPPC